MTGIRVFVLNQATQQLGDDQENFLHIFTCSFPKMSVGQENYYEVRGNYGTACTEARLVSILKNTHENLFSDHLAVYAAVPDNVIIYLFKYTGKCSK